MSEGGILRRLHGTCIAIGGAGVLLRGPSGAGKSDLALRMLEGGARLVSDDQTELFKRDGRLLARAPGELAGLMEVRGLGIVTRPSLAEVPLALVVDLVEESPERLPEEARVALEGEDLPLLRLRAFEDSTPAKIKLAVERQRSAVLEEARAAERHFVLVTGLSGAGRTASLKALEDGGYEAIDNLPLSLLQTVAAAAGPERPIAVGIDSRGRGFNPDRLAASVEAAAAGAAAPPWVLFITCDDDVLARRFTETRRPHPLAQDRPLDDGIRSERALLAPLRDVASEVIDTTELTLAELRREILERFAREGEGGMTLVVTSFSYRMGLPRNADLVFDLRFLENPHYQPALRDLTGLDSAVAEFVRADPDYESVFARLTGLLESLLPRYRAEGKSYLTVALGCTGGRHRSVAVAEALADWLSGEASGGPFRVTRLHRDLPVEAVKTHGGGG